MRKRLNAPRAAVLACYAQLARPLIMEAAPKRNNCVAATWITCKVLQRLGIGAEPLAVKLIVMNERRLQLLNGWMRAHPGEGWPPLPVEQHWRDYEGAHELGVGYGVDPDHPDYEPDGFDGHLVAWVPSRSVLLDASIDQCDRPEKFIGPMPGVLVMRAGADFRNGLEELTAKEGGAWLRYEAAPELTDWQSGADWRWAFHRYQRTVNAITNAIEEALTP